jgi:phosphatidylserine decarboxylase
LAVKEGREISLDEILRAPGPPWDGHLVGIFLTPLSVHVNRSPVTGVVRMRVHSPGSGMRAMGRMLLRIRFGKKPFERGSEHVLCNERETLFIDGDLPAYVTRIADPYVNRIVTWKTEGDAVAQGEKIGLIRMGSQTDVLFPRQVAGKRLRVTVKEGDYVYGGETALAAFE